MNMTEFFDSLREQKWAFYVPERVYRAHRDGLLRGWRVSESKRLSGSYRMTLILPFLKSQDAGLKLPFIKSEKPDWREEDMLKEFSDYLILHTGIEDYPPLPGQVIASDSFWDSLISRFGLTDVRGNRVLCWNNWVYCVRFCTVWVATTEPSLGSRPPYDISPTEKKEWHRKALEVRAKRKRLSKDYGLTSKYFGKNYTRKAAIVILKRAYSPEQMRHLRRQFAIHIRKCPAEVIRYAIENNLVPRR